MNLPDMPPAVRRGSLWLAWLLAIGALLRFGAEDVPPSAPTGLSARPAPALKPLGINTADSAALERLPGIGPSTARRIVRYRTAIGGFRTWDDFRRVYGMDTLLPRIQAYLYLDSIPAPLRQPKLTDQGSAKSRLTDRGSVRPQLPTPVTDPGSAKSKITDRGSATLPLDLNTADSLALVRLRGIGPAFARRILQYRERLGGFVSSDQLLEIYGWSDSLHQVVLPQLGTASPIAAAQRLNLNTDPLDLLARHPYLGWTRARRLVAWRERHGRLWELAQLTQIHGFSQSDVDRLRPYVMLD